MVISGLPSLPEDRATNDNDALLESHDFSQHADGGSYITYDEGSCSAGPPQQLYHQPSYPPQGDSSHCSRSTLSTSPHANLGMMADESMTSMALACPHSLLFKSHQVHAPSAATTATNNNNSNSALPFSWGTSSQLSRSAAVLLDEAGGGGGQQGQQLQPPTPIVPPPPLRSRSNTENSISSAATATTAESSFTATMVSRDWGSSGATTAGAATTNVGTFPQQPTPNNSGTASVSSMGDSVTSAPVPGVFFQTVVQQGRGGGGGNSSSYASTGPAHCVATSSLASALHRFNIDSDCEASIASNSITIDDPTNILMDDSCHNNYTMDDSASCASWGSNSIASCNTKPIPAKKKKKKKIGKNQRLLDRASAQHQERMMIQMKQQRAAASQQRVGSLGSGVGLPMPHQLGGGGGTTTTTPAVAASSAGGSVIVPNSPARSCSSSVASHASYSSLPLMHVDHQATPMSTPVAAMNIIGTTNNNINNNGSGDPNNMVITASHQLMSPPVLPKQPPSFGGSDLGRTPTASNCSQQQQQPPVVTLPAGVYIGGGGANYCGGRPLNYRPQLASKIHMPPPPPPPSNVVMMASSSSSSSPPTSSLLPTFPVHASSSEMETKLAKPSFPSPSPTVVKRAESVEDDVMEVAVTLSMLGGGGGGRTTTTASNGGGGMIPRVR